MAKQLAIFADNRSGRIKDLTEMLYKSGINIRAMAIQDRGEFGVIKFIVDKPDLAFKVLQEKNFACAMKEILAVVVEDKPGGLFQLLKEFPADGVNIVDAYGFAAQTAKGAIFYIEVKETTKMRELLESRGYKLLTDEEICEI